MFLHSEALKNSRQSAFSFQQVMSHVCSLNQVFRFSLFLQGSCLLNSLKRGQLLTERGCLTWENDRNAWKHCKALITCDINSFALSSLFLVRNHFYFILFFYFYILLFNLHDKIPNKQKLCAKCLFYQLFVIICFS